MMNLFRIQKSFQKIPFYMEAARSEPRESQISLTFCKKGFEVHFPFSFFYIVMPVGEKKIKSKYPKILNELRSVFFLFWC